MKLPVFPFLTGGFIVGGAKFIADRASPLWASLVGSTPNDIVTAYFLKNDTEKKKYLVGYVIQSIMFFAITVLLYLLLKHSKINANLLLVLGIILWLGVSIVIIKYTKPLINKHFKN